MKAEIDLRERGASRTNNEGASGWNVGPEGGDNPVDVVVLLSATASTEEFSSWIVQRITRAIKGGLDVTHSRSSGTHKQQIALLISAPYRTLLNVAEQVRLRKRLRPGCGGGLAEFTVDAKDAFMNVESSDLFLTSQERQTLIMAAMDGIHSVSEDLEAPLTPALRTLEGQPLVARLRVSNVISDIFPLHDKRALDQLKRRWVLTAQFRQPLDQVREYFGTEVAFYFSWLGFYTRWLVLPAATGALFWFVRGRSQWTTDVCSVLFSMFNVVWVTLFLEFWKRQSAEQSYNWGTLDTDSNASSLQYPRPLFKGEPHTSPITGRREPYYPQWKRLVTIGCLTIPALIASLVFVFGLMFLTLELQEWADATGSWWIKILPKVVLSVLVSLSGDLYQRAVVWLNELENYRTEAENRNGLIVKLGAFHFMNNFFALFYLAFYLKDMRRLSEFLAALLITRQVVGNFREVLVPYLKDQMGQQQLLKDSGAPGGSRGTPSSPVAQIKDRAAGVVSDLGGVLKHVAQEVKHVARKQKDDESDDDKRNTISRASIESEMPAYDDLFEDYLEMFIQLGYVVFFSSAFPLAGLCALINNVFEVRVDGFKLCSSFRRPFAPAAPTQGIGVWQDMMEVMGVIAVMINCSLLVASGELHRLFPALSLPQIVLIAVGIEHVALALKWGISVLIPDLPDWVATEVAKVEFKRIQALREQETAATRARSRDPSPATRPRSRDASPAAPAMAAKRATTTTQPVIVETLPPEQEPML